MGNLAGAAAAAAAWPPTVRAACSRGWVTTRTGTGTRPPRHPLPCPLHPLQESQRQGLWCRRTQQQCSQQQQLCKQRWRHRPCQRQQQGCQQGCQLPGWVTPWAPTAQRHPPPPPPLQTWRRRREAGVITAVGHSACPGRGTGTGSQPRVLCGTTTTRATTTWWCPWWSSPRRPLATAPSAATGTATTVSPAALCTPRLPVTPLQVCPPRRPAAAAPAAGTKARSGSCAACGPASRSWSGTFGTSPRRAGVAVVGVAAACLGATGRAPAPCPPSPPVTTRARGGRPRLPALGQGTGGRPPSCQGQRAQGWCLPHPTMVVTTVVTTMDSRADTAKGSSSSPTLTSSTSSTRTVVRGPLG